MCSSIELIVLLHNVLLRRFDGCHRIADMPEDEHDYHQTKTTSGDDSSADELFIFFQIHLRCPFYWRIDWTPTRSNEFPGCLMRLLSLRQVA